MGHVLPFSVAVERSGLAANAEIGLRSAWCQRRTFQAVLGEGRSRSLRLPETDAAGINWRLAVIRHLVDAQAEPLRQPCRTHFHIITQMPHDLDRVADIRFAESDANGR